MQQSEEFKEVLRFWFPDLSSADHARIAQQFEWWFRGGADTAICERFADLLERAIRGDLDQWARQACSRLALFPFSISEHGARIRAGSQGVEARARRN